MSTTMTMNTQLTLVELAKNIDPNGQLHRVAQILNQTNSILQDAPWFQANDVFGHTVAQEASEPTGAWRHLNDGVANEDVQTVQKKFGIGMLETYCTSDKKLVDVAPDPVAFRNGRAARFLRGLSKTLAYTMIYGDASTDTEKFTGIRPHVNTLNSGTVQGAGGSTTLTSMYVVQWGEGKVYMVYPRGSTIGISHEDLGRVTVTGSAATKLFEAYRDHFQVHCGLVVEDPRCVGRYANLEPSGTSYTFDEDTLISIMNAMPDDWAGAAIYVNSSIMTQMEIALKNRANVNFTQEQGLGGVPVLRFKGVPVRRVDQIINTETSIS